jgi:hypothetical protein
MRMVQNKNWVWEDGKRRHVGMNSTRKTHNGYAFYK